jgi:chitin synthase
MFGGVTCLPGCFSMYRIKAPKAESGYWVPILANPDIVEHYSENIVDTLHKKNLLLLGEDRYLTTLMLKTFPKRKMVFCPQAVCKTIVPDQFSVLLSQRRRWINSTIHNLAELLLVRDLCGTFCFSMQFVVFMELAGTLVLPAAISFTVYLIISSAISGGSQNVIPLVLLAIILGLPGLLIVVTSRKVAYLGWMLVYLFSLPVWNLILPTYAFWHFDDFSWGQTRRVAGDEGGNHGDKEGVFDSSHIVMKRWAEFERERRWRMGTQSRDSTFNGLNARGWVDPNSRNSMQSGLTQLIHRNRYSLISVPDTSYDPHGRPGFMNAQQYSDSREGSPHSYPRNRSDATPLLTLPAPIAVSPATGTPSGSSSLADAPYVRIADTSMTVSPSSSEVPGDPERDSNSSGPTMVNMGPHAVIRAAPGQTIYPGETPNPYRNSQPQMATYDQAPVPHVALYGYAPEPTMDEYQQQQQYMPSPAQPPQPIPSPSPLPQQLPEPEKTRRQSRGYSLVDPGVVSSSEMQVRRVANRQSRRQSGSHATPRSNQRNSGHFPSSPSSPLPQNDFYMASPPSQQYFLPPGAAPPRGHHGPQ